MHFSSSMKNLALIFILVCAPIAFAETQAEGEPIAADSYAHSGEQIGLAELCKLSVRPKGSKAILSASFKLVSKTANAVIYEAYVGDYGAIITHNSGKLAVYSSFAEPYSKFLDSRAIRQTPILREVYYSVIFTMRDDGHPKFEGKVLPDKMSRDHELAKAFFDKKITTEKDLLAFLAKEGTLLEDSKGNDVENYSELKFKISCSGQG